MVATVTLLADHKGMTTPRVAGDEYFVDAVVDVTAYEAGGVTVNASTLGLSRINAVAITGMEKSSSYQATIEVSAAGAYASGTSFQVFLVKNDGGNQEADTNNDNTIKVRVWGIL